MENINISTINHKQLMKKTGLSRSFLYEMMRQGSKCYDEHLASAKLWLSGQPGKGPVRYLEKVVEEWLLSKLAISQAYLKGNDVNALEVTPPSPALVTNVVPLVHRMTIKGARNARPSSSDIKRNEKMKVAA